MDSWGVYAAIPYYREFVITNKNDFILRVKQSSIQKYVLVKLNNISPYISFHDVLEQQKGNLFEVDGNLIWTQEREELLIYSSIKQDRYLECWLVPTTTIPLLYNIDFKIQTNIGRDGTYLRETDQSPFHSKLRTKTTNTRSLSILWEQKKV